MPSPSRLLPLLCGRTSPPPHSSAIEVLARVGASTPQLLFSSSTRRAVLVELPCVRCFTRPDLLSSRHHPCRGAMHNSTACHGQRPFFVIFYVRLCLLAPFWLSAPRINKTGKVGAAQIFQLYARGRFHHEARRYDSLGWCRCVFTPFTVAGYR